MFLGYKNSAVILLLSAQVAACTLPAAELFSSQQAVHTNGKDPLQEVLEQMCMEYGRHQCSTSGSPANARFWQCSNTLDPKLSDSESSIYLWETVPLGAQQICNLDHVFKSDANAHLFNDIHKKLQNNQITTEQSVAKAAWMVLAQNVQAREKINKAIPQNIFTEIQTTITKLGNSITQQQTVHLWNTIIRNLVLFQHIFAKGSVHGVPRNYQAKLGNFRLHILSMAKGLRTIWKTQYHWKTTLVRSAGIRSTSNEMSPGEWQTFTNILGFTIALFVGNEIETPISENYCQTWDYISQNDYTAQLPPSSSAVSIGNLAIQAGAAQSAFQTEFSNWYYDRENHTGIGSRLEKDATCTTIFDNHKPEELTALYHGQMSTINAGPVPIYAAFAFLCADKTPEGRWQIKTKPSILRLPDAVRRDTPIRILLINVSPRLGSADDEQIAPLIAFGLEAPRNKNRMATPLVQLTFPAFSVYGLLPDPLDSSEDVFVVEPGFANALWIDTSFVSWDYLQTLEFTAAPYPIAFVPEADRNTDDVWWGDPRATVYLSH